MIVFFLVLNWLLAIFWIARTFTALRNLPGIPNLLNDKYAQPLPAQTTPLIAVIVPARNEAQDVEATLRSLLAIESVSIEIVAIDDRSTDATGAIIDRVAAEARAAGKQITVLHVTQLPGGWMGKTHAMALAARQVSAPWLLFTDADILFSPDSLLRAINFATAEAADHCVVFPTMILKTFGERMMISLLQVIASIFSGLWKIPDPRARRNSLGVGAFNLIRADTYRAMGGFESLRMEVLEDLRLGFEVKNQGYRQRIAFGRDMVRVRWAVGATGFIRNVTKNFFAVFRFRTLPAIAASAALGFLCLGPFLLSAILPFAGRRGAHTAPAYFPAMLIAFMLLLLYRYYRQFTGISALYTVTFPLAVCLLLYSIVRSVVLTLAYGGVRWRGTHYPLKELREHSGRLR